MVVVIDADHISEPERGETSREGWRIDVRPTSAYQRLVMLHAGEDPNKQLPDSLDGANGIKFRLYDDDGELHYEGRLSDDEDCENQMAALDFGIADTGACILKVLRDGKWKQEIG